MDGFVIDAKPMKRNLRPGARPKYPWGQLKLGASFFVPSDKPREMQQHLSSLGNGISKAIKWKGRKFSTGRVDGGVRVWRVK